MLPAAKRADLEARVQRLCTEQVFDQAVSETLRSYGPEIVGFLGALAKDESAATEAFSLFCEHVWRGLPKFQWRSALRTWVYVVARNALRLTLRSARRRAWVPLSDARVDQIAQEIRTSTAHFLRTEARDLVAQLRRELPAEDQQLLVLRIARRMPWTEIAQVLHEGDMPLDEAGIRKEAARLRQRYARAKARLETMVEQHGDGS
ncbi:MAG: sigma-70 family RNA polymerase sigma factor [Myxococcota bacterium]